METIVNLESFVRSAECGSFSLAARRLGLTPAAVSRNVAQLEKNLGVRLFQRSTRGLTTTEAGEHFLRSVRGGLDTIQGAIANISTAAGEPAGTLKINSTAGFAIDFLLPLMPDFQRRYPAVTIDWLFDNRPLDLIAGGFDVEIGGGFELAGGIVARELARIRLIAVASPAFLKGRVLPADPAELGILPGVVLRSPQTNRVRIWVMRNGADAATSAVETPTMIVNDPDALCAAVLAGVGAGLVATPHAERHLESGALVRLLDGWHVDVGPLSVYFPSQKLLPAKTRAFVDFTFEAFRTRALKRAFALPGGSP